MRTLLLLLLLLSPSPRQGKSLFVVVVDRARPIRCIGSGLAAVCPARFLITPTTVVLRSSRGEGGGEEEETQNPDRGVFSTDDNSPTTTWIVSRLIKVERAASSVSSIAGIRVCIPCHATENLFFAHPPLLFLLFGSSPHSSWRNSFYSWSEVSVQLRPIERLAWERGIDACTCPRDIVYRNVHWFLGITSSMVISLDF